MSQQYSSRSGSAGAASHASTGSSSKTPTSDTEGLPRTGTDCSEAVLRLFELLDGELGPADCARIEQHLNECAPCFREYQLDAALKAVVKRSCAPAAAPIELRTTILRRITTVRVDTVD
jgi:mycothiol system anti-sigma-R factor